MAVVRRVNAKTFAQAGTAAEAFKLMEANKVPLEERPPAWQIKNFRPSKGRVQEREVADCIHSLQEFLRSPPENIFVWEQPICGADKIQIGFSSKLAMDTIMSYHGRGPNFWPRYCASPCRCLWLHSPLAHSAELHNSLGHDRWPGGGCAQTLHARSWAFRAWSLCEDLVDSWRFCSHSSRSQHVPEEEDPLRPRGLPSWRGCFRLQKAKVRLIPSRGQWMLSCRKIAQRNFFLVWWPKPVQCRSWMPVAKRKKHFAWLRPIRAADASVRAPMGTSAHVTTRWLHLKSTSVSSMTPSKRQLSMQCLIGRNPKLISPFSSPKQSPRASKSSRSKAIGFWMNVVGCVTFFHALPFRCLGTQQDISIRSRTCQGLGCIQDTIL